MPDDSIKLDYIVCRVVDGEVVPLDIHPRLARQLSSILAQAKGTAKKKPASKMVVSVPQKAPVVPENDLSEKVSVKDKPRKKYTFSPESRRRMSWIARRSSEIKAQGLSRPEAWRWANDEWKARGNLEDSQPKPDKPRRYGRPRSEERIAAHNKKMQRWNGDDRDDPKYRCAVCHKNPVIGKHEICPSCESVFPES